MNAKRRSRDFFSAEDKERYRKAISPAIEFISILLAIFSFLKSDMLMTISYITIAVIYFAWILYSISQKNKDTHPYLPTQNFPGLVSPDNIIMANGEWKIIPVGGSGVPKPITLNGRTMEIEQIKQLADNIIINSSQEKFGIALVGESGCGKSFILRMFEQEITSGNRIRDDSYIIREYKNDYEKFGFFVKDLFGTDNGDWTLPGDRNKKWLFILDHFERVFDLYNYHAKKDEHLQNDIIGYIKKLAKVNNVAIIFSFRKERLLDFMRVFDISDISNDYAMSQYGVLSQIKSRGIDSKGAILVCSSDRDERDDTYVRAEGSFEEEKEIIDAVESDRNKNLIQRQIIYNMIENERNHSGLAYRAIDLSDTELLLQHYFEHQLLCTGNYYMASRIMYFLSVARIRGMKCSNLDVQEALCILKNEVGEYNRVVKILEEFQLVRQHTRKGDSAPEIVHDYIAKKYEVYANTELFPEIKIALDENISEKEKGNKGDNGVLRNELINSIGMNRLGKMSYICFFIMSWIIVYLRYKLIDHEVRPLTVTIAVIYLVSAIYSYILYEYGAKYYVGKQRGCMSLLYILSLVFGVVAIGVPGIIATYLGFDVSIGRRCNEFWLAWFGMGDAILGVSYLIVSSDKDLSAVARERLSSYGWKTVLPGCLIIAHSLALVIGMSKESMLLVIEELLAVIGLVGYAFIAHISREYLYANMSAFLSLKKRKKST